MERRSNRQKKGVNYRIDNQSSDSEDDFVPSSKKTKVAVGAATAPKRSSREERQFNKELDSALKASLTAAGTAEGTHNGQQHSTMADQGHVKTTVTKKGTFKVSKPAVPLSLDKEVCTERNSTDPWHRKTTGCVSPDVQSSNDSCDGDTREPMSWNGDAREPLSWNGDAREPLSWNEDITKPTSESTSDGYDCVGKSVSTKAKLKGDKSQTESDQPSTCIEVITSKGCIGSISTKPAGVKKAAVSAEQLKCKSSGGANHSVRVGLSRNIHIKPLHPKLKAVLQ